jgi:hypothetical protein
VIAVRARPGSLLVAAVVLLAGCRSSLPTLEPAQLAVAAAELGQSTPVELAALYRLRVPVSSRLRLAVVSGPKGGRLSVSEPFGALLSVTAWSEHSLPRLFDLRAGCRLDRADLTAVLGLPALPIEQAIQLLAGRLPTLGGERVEPTADGRLLVEGAGWAALVTVQASPWRVVKVEQADERRGWSVELRRHASAVPGWVRLERADGRWAELELVRMQAGAGGALPKLPDLPPCAAAEGQP